MKPFLRPLTTALLALGSALFGFLPAQADVTSPLSLFVLPGDATVAGADNTQSAATIAQGNGSALAVWTDHRANVSGQYEYETSTDIYGIRVDSTGARLDAVPIAIVANAASQENPKVVWNGTAWLVIYESNTTSGTGYYERVLQAVRVSAAGVVLDAKPIVLHGVVPLGSSYWSAASDGSGWVVVNHGSSTGSDIIATRISSTGQVLDPPNRVLVDSTYYLRSNLRLVWAAGVYFLTFNDASIVSGSDTKAVRFNSLLTRLDPAPLSFLPASLSGLASNGTQFYATWFQQQPDFSVPLVGSRVSITGSLLDAPGRVITTTTQPYTSISTAWDGSAWKISWGLNNALRLGTVTAAGTVTTPGGIALPGLIPGSLASNGSGGLLAIWQAESANGTTDISGASINSAGLATTPLTLSVGAPMQTRPDIATGAEGYLVVYRSSTSTTTRILAQPLDASGFPLSDEPTELVSGSGVLAQPGPPAVAWNAATSQYLVVWGHPTQGILGRRVRPDGSAVDAAPLVLLPQCLGPADVASLEGSFLVTARKYGYSPQFIDAVAKRIRASDAAVLDPALLYLGGGYVSRPPAVVTLGSRWLVAWHSNWSHDSSNADTGGIFVPLTGAPSASFSLNSSFSTAGGNGIFEIGLGSNGTEALFVQSQELTSGVETDLTARIIHADGTLLPSINLTPWTGNQYRPRVAWNGTHFIVVYQEQKNRLTEVALDPIDARCDLFGMRVTSSGTKLDPQGFVLTQSPVGETDPTITNGNGTALFAGALMLNTTPLANYRTATGFFRTQITQPPVAVAGASVTGGDIPLSVTFNTTGSFDPDGTISVYGWDFGDGTTGSGASPTHVYSSEGPFVATVTAFDNQVVGTMQSLLIRAVKPNQSPIALVSASTLAGPYPLNVIFDAGASYDPDGPLGNIRWNFSTGSEYWGATAYETFQRPGTYTATATVFDSRGASTTSAPLTIVVKGANTAPVAVASATPLNGTSPLPVQFSSAGSKDADGGIVSYRWDFADGNISEAANPTHTYQYPGTYPVELVITDTSGATATARVTVKVTGTLRSSAINLTATLNGSRVTATGVVTVIDHLGAPVPNATVTATWTKPGNKKLKQNVITNELGQATFVTSGNRGTYTLRINTIVRTGYTFSAAGSVLTRSITK